MNLFISPLLIMGLLASSSPVTGECVAVLSTARVCENCAIEVSGNGAEDNAIRQSRKHTAYYYALAGAPREAGSKPTETRQYSARIDETTPPEFQTQ